MKYAPGNINDKIKSVGTTEGKEYMTLDGVEYLGIYHIIGNTIYTGILHDKNSMELIEYNPNKSYVKYTNLKDFYLLSKYDSPKSYIPIVKEDEYKKGYFNRYFVKQKNNLNARIIEVDKKQYESLNKKDTGINENFYFGISLKWKIIGPKNDVYEKNKIFIYGVEDTNRREVLIKEKEMKNIFSVLRNLTDFARI